MLKEKKDFLKKETEREREKKEQKSNIMILSFESCFLSNCKKWKRASFPGERCRSVHGLY